MTSLFRALLASAIGLILASGVAWLAGDDPILVLSTILNSAFSSPYALGTTLMYTAPLLCAGLAVAIPFRAGLFNIGAEGQLVMGAIGASAVGILGTNLHPLSAQFLALAAAVVSGALWGSIAGWIKTHRGGHEVITTIMLNFIAASAASWWCIDLFPNADTQNPEATPIKSEFVFRHLPFFDGANLAAISILSVIGAVVSYFFLTRTTHGFALRAVGINDNAARIGGINPNRTRIIAMIIAGGFAGLIGFIEVFGNSGTLRLGFSPGYGFMGIAVAFLARNNPLAIIPAAFLFALLHKGSLDLEFETEHITRDLASVIQAIVVLAVAADGLWSWVPFFSKSRVNQNES